ncbi:MAG: ankyrin repeat domain-containing protein, partial [Bryobacterales bacterium]|nr:ankyrin repeat domain-containing protein [Bryobacterales bacterium]
MFSVSLAVGACALVFSLTAFAGNESRIADAAMNADQAAVLSLLQQKVDVNAPQADGATALQWAVYRDDLQMA